MSKLASSILLIIICSFYSCANNEDKEVERFGLVLSENYSESVMYSYVIYKGEKKYEKLVERSQQVTVCDDGKILHNSKNITVLEKINNCIKELFEKNKISTKSYNNAIFLFIISDDFKTSSKYTESIFNEKLELVKNQLEYNLISFNETATHVVTNNTMAFLAYMAENLEFYGEETLKTSVLSLTNYRLNIVYEPITDGKLPEGFTSKHKFFNYDFTIYNGELICNGLENFWRMVLFDLLSNYKIPQEVEKEKPIIVSNVCQDRKFEINVDSNFEWGPCFEKVEKPFSKYSFLIKSAFDNETCIDVIKKLLVGNSIKLGCNNCLLPHIASSIILPKNKDFIGVDMFTKASDIIDKELILTRSFKVGDLCERVYRVSGDSFIDTHKCFTLLYMQELLFQFKSIIEANVDISENPSGWYSAAVSLDTYLHVLKINHILWTLVVIIMTFVALILVIITIFMFRHYKKVFKQKFPKEHSIFLWDFPFTLKSR